MEVTAVDSRDEQREVSIKPSLSSKKTQQIHERFL